MTRTATALTPVEPADGADRAHRAHRGGPAGRAMARWAWRLFRREWRQQLLILALIVVAVAAVVVGSAVAADTPRPATATFGTAQDLAAFSGPDPHLAGQIASLRHRFGAVDVVENQTARIPGSVDTFDLRAERAPGHFTGPLLSLVSGHDPTGPGQVALTSGVASGYDVSVGSRWTFGGVTRTVVGIVQDPDSLLDEFALVVPGQVAHPSTVTVLFDAHGVPARTIGSDVRAASGVSTSDLFNPTTIVLALATIGMLLIALVGVGGFTVLAQRRLRSIGMVESLGATDRHVRLVVVLNGIVVGVTGAVVGLVVGLCAWLAYRPTAAADAHHVIGTFALPWDVIGPSMALAVLATYFAASRPARTITRVPVVAALSGRPAPPRKVHRSAVPGVVLLVVAFVLFGVASGNRSPAAVIPAFVLLIAAIVMVAPFFLTLLATVRGGVPVAVRLALRDLSRYRARSGSALAAVSLGVLIAVIITVIAAGRYGNVLDYAGPNLASNQLVVHTATRTAGPRTQPTGPSPPAPTAATLRAEASTADSIAASLGSHDVVALESTSATLQHAAPGRNYNGPLYVATPALLRAMRIDPSTIDPHADVLSMRPGLSSLSRMQLVYGGYFSSQLGPRRGHTDTFRCPRPDCLANPVIQQVSALPPGTSAPNTVITEHAVRSLHLQVSTAGWFIQAPSAPSASQLDNARLLASTQHLSIESKSSAPSSSEITGWATVFGIVLALGILAMSVGLIRSETGGDLRTLAATGAGRGTRRALTATTAGALALLGAVIGTAGAYVAALGFFRSTRSTGLAALGHVPAADLALIVVGMPLVAALAGWLLAGRQPPAMAHRAIE